MPKYLSIANEIEEQILSHTLTAGAQLPTEKELMQQFGVSRQTIRNAFSCLLKKNLIYTVKGSGTFIADYSRPAPASKNIAVLLTKADEYIFPYKSAGINSVLTQHGYISNIFVSDNRVDLEQDTLHEILTSNYAVAIIEVTKAAIPRFGKIFAELRAKLPLILIDGYYRDLPDIPYVALDDHKGGYKATEYLIQHGHKNIFHVGKIEDLQGILRYQGYADALTHYNLPFSEDHVFWMTDTLLSDMPDSLLDMLCEKILQCTAVFFYNDWVAEIVLGALVRRNIRIPNDLSVVSYDNSLLSMFRQITCIPHPLDNLGKVAAENLLKLIENPNYDATYIFEPEIVERSSVRNLNTEQHDIQKEVFHEQFHACSNI